jgi:alkanesulfonate monooxygenase SsuD/methylene tetrahydromethanopterin reductase-like flavin-dependent oxidoreductase (luciferase family)
MAGLSTLCDSNIIMGLGLGTFPHEFEAAGYKKTTLQDRANIAKINAQLCRRFWAGEKISYKDDYYDFKDVELKPTPSKKIPIWYGGGTPASCRRAADYCDGWMPGRIPTATFNKMVKYLEEQCKLAGRPMVTTGAIPITSIDKNRDVALSKVNVKGLINEGNAPSKKTWVKPASGTFSKVEDIEGLLIAGTPADIARDTKRYEDAGLNHIVYDLRFRYADWYEQIDLLGQEVLPKVRA